MLICDRIIIKVYVYGVYMSTNEHIEHLGGGIRVIVSEEHTFGTDALLLADFSMPRRKDIACDFGTGCGIIPFFWLRESAARQIYAVEIQQNAFSQLERSVQLNDSGDKLFCINSDLCELKGKIPFGQFDVVTMNPPYTADGDGIKSKSDSARIARHEMLCGLDDICLSASKLLKFGGRLCMCLRPERLCELITAMKNSGIEPKRMRFVSQRQGCAPWLVLLEGKRGRNSGLTVEKELYIEQNGKESDEMLRIIGSYRENESDG